MTQHPWMVFAQEMMAQHHWLMPVCIALAVLIAAGAEYVALLWLGGGK